MKQTIVIVSDAWEPQVNGVVRTLRSTIAELEAAGYQVVLITPQGKRVFSLPSYPEIKLSITGFGEIRQTLKRYPQAAVHIATEGTLGLMARAWCSFVRRPFTTSYHTQYPEYIAERLPVPLGLSYALLRWFHNGSARTLVATESMRAQLREHGFKNLVHWGRGVDTEQFKLPTALPDAQTPILVYMGRVAPEKNIKDFLELELPFAHRKWVIGDGPVKAALQGQFPEVTFFGYLHGEALSQQLAKADVFVFPSKTDTFGLVILEANACGLPVAAYPFAGPVDLILPGVNGELSHRLDKAVMRAMQIGKSQCRAYAQNFSWQKSSADFAKHMCFPCPVVEGQANVETAYK
ncbi:MAG: glycosyltransferase family 1 protein [Gammaproteobacteria bacterium]|nr:glycosyltransferase family 1 protein [Gammaproteobacteria bacterium]